jgi:hypothetical protein
MPLVPARHDTVPVPIGHVGHPAGQEIALGRTADADGNRSLGRFQAGGQALLLGLSHAVRQDAHAHFLGGLLDLLHGLANPGSRGLVAAIGLGHVVGGILHHLHQAFVRFHVALTPQLRGQGVDWVDRLGRFYNIENGLSDEITPIPMPLDKRKLREVQVC